ncbi:hypothetical protein [Nocardia yamanashiensis]|uniref:hypothetical protein n=1 Tax=Nocardia yamanashiensis TaxID=209247 RepID=UPI0022B84531|nr:hypothetical protein [Nocardia yamanashiensis]
MDGSNAGADARDALPSRPLPKPVAYAAIGVGAVSAGLVLIGACGLGGQDVYVAPPPMNANLQVAETVSSGTTTPAVIIPPSPSWRVAADQPPRRPRTTVSETDSPDADPSGDTTTRTTPSRPTTSRTTRPRPTTTEPAPPTTDPVRPTTTEAPPTEPAASTSSAARPATTAADDE